MYKDIHRLCVCVYVCIIHVRVYTHQQGHNLRPYYVLKSVFFHWIPTSLSSHTSHSSPCLILSSFQFSEIPHVLSATWLYPMLILLPGISFTLLISTPSISFKGIFFWEAFHSPLSLLGVFSMCSQMTGHLPTSSIRP